MIYLLTLPASLWALAFIVDRALKFAATLPDERPVTLADTMTEEVRAAQDPAVNGIARVGVWDEIEFDGKRYRYNRKDHSVGKHGWLAYPSGCTPETSEWCAVDADYRRRLAVDRDAETAVAARKAWGIGS